MKNVRFLLIFFIIVMTISCVNTKNAIYFNNTPDAVIASTIESEEPVIHKNDLLSISISSLSPEASLLFNSPNVEATSGSATSNGVTAKATGYLVDKEGNIQMPILGNIKAEGLKKNDLKNLIAKSLSDRKLLIDPIVTVRYLNFQVTVLGEVLRPGVLTITNEKISLLEALGLVGDVTIYAKRDNIMVLREEAGKKIIKRLNLNSTEIFTSPYYYLRSNDIVYVEPNKERVSSANNTGARNASLYISAASIIIILADRLLR